MSKLKFHYALCGSTWILALALLGTGNAFSLRKTPYNSAEASHPNPDLNLPSEIAIPPRSGRKVRSPGDEWILHSFAFRTPHSTYNSTPSSDKIDVVQMLKEMQHYSDAKQLAGTHNFPQSSHSGNNEVENTLPQAFVDRLLKTPDFATYHGRSRNVDTPGYEQVKTENSIPIVPEDSIYGRAKAKSKKYWSSSYKQLPEELNTLRDPLKDLLLGTGDNYQPETPASYSATKSTKHPAPATTTTKNSGYQEHSNSHKSPAGDLALLSDPIYSSDPLESLLLGTNPNSYNHIYSETSPYSSSGSTKSNSQYTPPETYPATTSYNEETPYYDPYEATEEEGYGNGNSPFDYGHQETPYENEPENYLPDPEDPYSDNTQTQESYDTSSYDDKDTSYDDHSYDKQPSYDKETSYNKQPSYEKQPSYDRKQPTYDNKETSYDKQPSYGKVENSYDNKQPSYDHKKPSYDSKETPYNNKQPSYNPPIFVDPNCEEKAKYTQEESYSKGYSETPYNSPSEDSYAPTAYNEEGTDGAYDTYTTAAPPYYAPIQEYNSDPLAQTLQNSYLGPQNYKKYPYLTPTDDKYPSATSYDDYYEATTEAPYHEEYSSYSDKKQPATYYPPVTTTTTTTTTKAPYVYESVKTVDAVESSYLPLNPITTAATAYTKNSTTPDTGAIFTSSLSDYPTRTLVPVVKKPPAKTHSSHSSSFSSNSKPSSSQKHSPYFRRGQKYPSSLNPRALEDGEEVQHPTDYLTYIPSNPKSPYEPTPLQFPPYSPQSFQSLNPVINTEIAPLPQSYPFSLPSRRFEPVPVNYGPYFHHGGDARIGRSPRTFIRPNKRLHGNDEGVSGELHRPRRGLVEFPISFGLKDAPRGGGNYGRDHEYKRWWNEYKPAEVEGAQEGVHHYVNYNYEIPPDYGRDGSERPNIRKRIWYGQRERYETESGEVTYSNPYYYVPDPVRPTGFIDTPAPIKRLFLKIYSPKELITPDKLAKVIEGMGYDPYDPEDVVIQYVDEVPDIFSDLKSK